MACEVLIAHIDTDYVWHLTRGNGTRRQCVHALIDADLICRGEHSGATKLTEDGRAVLCSILAHAADLLMQAGALRVAHRDIVASFIRVAGMAPEIAPEMAASSA